MIRCVFCNKIKKMIIIFKDKLDYLPSIEFLRIQFPYPPINLLLIFTPIKGVI